MGQNRGSRRRKPDVRIEDRRWPRPVWIDIGALGRVSEHFSGRRLQAARTIYLSLAELVAESTDGVKEATRREVADRAGVTTKTLDEYVAELEEARVIGVKRRSDGEGGNLPNLWWLVGPDRDGPPGSNLGTQTDLAEADDAVQSSSSPASGEEKKTTLAKQKGGGALAWDDLVVEASERSSDVAIVPTEMQRDAVAHRARKAKVDGHVVTATEMVRAAAALAEFNAAQGADHGLGANLSRIVMRLRDRPSWDAAKLRRLVQSAWRIRWWESSSSKRRPTPAVLFSPGSFEQCVQDAAAEAAGQPTEQVKRRRFDRAVTR